MKNIVFITIGQAPRKDISKTYDKYFEGMDNVRQIGVLDGLTHDEAVSIVGAQPGEHVLTSRLLSGKSIVMSQEKVEKRLQSIIDKLEESNVDVISILCTGSFENLHTRKAQLIEAEKITIPYSKIKFEGRKIGIMVPLKSQISDSKAKWNLGERCTMVSASPYMFDEQKFKEASLKLVRSGVDVIILDCMGYNSDIAGYISRYSHGIPVIQSNELFFKYISEEVNI